MSDASLHAGGPGAAGPGQPAWCGRLFGDVLRQGGGTALNAAGGLLVLLVLGRVLGPERFGDYVAVLSAAVVVLTLLEGGWPARVYRDSVAAAGDPNGAAQALVGHALGYLTVAAAAIALCLLPLGIDPLAYFGALLCMSLVALMNLVSARMRAAGRFGLEAGWQIAGRVASGGVIIIGALWFSSAAGAIFLYWSLGLFAVLLFGGQRWLSRPRWTGLRAALPLTVPFLAIDALAVLMMKGDVALARWVGANDAPLSHYAACTRLNEAALLLFAPVGNVLLRSLRLHVHEPARFGRLWRSGVALGAAAGTLAVVGSMLWGEWLMTRLFGAEFSAAGRLLPYTAAMLPFALGNLVLIQAIVARGGERRLVWLLGPAALIMAAALWLGWRAGGAHGGAVALALTHALVWAPVVLWLSRSAGASRSTSG